MTPGATTRMAGWLESAWLARYLDRQLEGEELAWFEAYLLDKPELLGMVEVDNEFRQALASGEIMNAGVSPPANGHPLKPSGRSSHSRAKHRLAWAMTLVLGLGVGWFGNDSVRRGADTVNVVANPTRMLFDTMRGSAKGPIIEHEASGSSYVVVEVAVPPRAEQVELRVGNQMPVSLEPSVDGFVSFLADRQVLGDMRGAKIQYNVDGRSFERPIQMAVQTGERK